MIQSQENVGIETVTASDSSGTQTVGEQCSIFETLDIL